VSGSSKGSGAAAAAVRRAMPAQQQRCISVASFAHRKRVQAVQRPSFKRQRCPHDRLLCELGLATET